MLKLQYCFVSFCLAMSLTCWQPQWLLRPPFLRFCTLLTPRWCLLLCIAWFVSFFCFLFLWKHTNPHTWVSFACSLRRLCASTNVAVAYLGIFDDLEKLALGNWRWYLLFFLFDCAAGCYVGMLAPVRACHWVGCAEPPFLFACTVCCASKDLFSLHHASICPFAHMVPEMFHQEPMTKACCLSVEFYDAINA